MISNRLQRTCILRLGPWSHQGQGAFFCGIVTKRMRQVLYDYAKEQCRARRGAGAKQVELADVTNEKYDKSKELLELEQALTKLGQIDER